VLCLSQHPPFTFPGKPSHACVRGRVPSFRIELEHPPTRPSLCTICSAACLWSCSQAARIKTPTDQFCYCCACQDHGTTLPEIILSFHCCDWRVLIQYCQDGRSIGTCNSLFISTVYTDVACHQLQCAISVQDQGTKDPVTLALQF
jgi:hypothetical protein